MSGRGINQRFVEFVELNKLRKKEIAVLLGVADTRFKQWEDNTRPISADLIQIICAQFPALNARWLITGEGEMMLTAQEQLNNANGTDGLQNKSVIEFLKQQNEEYKREILELSKKNAVLDYIINENNKMKKA
jgi:transcriptional regulator with XRE-family HTH domain